MEEKYISIERVEVITGIPLSQLIQFVVDTESIEFYYLSPSGMREVPLPVVEKIKKQLNSGKRQPVKVHVLNKLTIDQLHMRDEDIRKCISYVESQEENFAGECIPVGHECTPKGLLIAFDCWKHFYEHLSEEDGKQISVEDRKEWIKKNHPDISKSFRDEIAKVANPFPLGGQKKKKNNF